jgi:hypothetical protein
MVYLGVEISRFVDEYQPGVVECRLVDAHGRTHLIVEKVPVVTTEGLGSDSRYPKPGAVACEVEMQWEDSDGRSLVRVNTARPWSVESTEGATSFVVLSSQLTRGQPHV